MCFIDWGGFSEVGWFRVSARRVVNTRELILLLGSRTWHICSSLFLPPLPSCLPPDPDHKYLSNAYSTDPVLGTMGSKATWVEKPGASGPGHEITKRVKPQVTRSQINSAPPNAPQSSLVTACWSAGSSLALISLASVLGQAAIFHVLKTDDPGVREMKAPFSRSVGGLGGEGG